MNAFLTLASFWLPYHPTSCYYSKGFDSANFRFQRKDQNTEYRYLSPLFCTEF